MQIVTRRGKCMINHIMGNAYFYILLSNSFLLVLAIVLIAFSRSNVDAKKDIDVDYIIKKIGDAYYESQKNITKDYNSQLIVINEKIESLINRPNITELKLKEIKDRLEALECSVRELDFRSDENVGMNTTAADDTTYRFARKLILEGQPIESIIQQTNLSRDEINILRNLSTQNNHKG